jgi:simple sugar transport system substrate-binding protein
MDERSEMADHDVLGDALERLEWDESRQARTPLAPLRQLTRRTALTGGAAGIAAAMLEACGSGSGSAGASGRSAAAGIFGPSQSYRFTLVNHVTTNTFFTPTQSGASDACRLLGCRFQWAGSETSSVSEMVSAIDRAIRDKASGIATTLIDPTAFNPPVEAALSAGIPVVAYNSDATGNGRLAYIGQDLFKSGQEMGRRIAALVPAGDIALFIATPGSLNLEPRIAGVQDTLRGNPAINAHVVATGAAQSEELTTVDAYVTAHPSYKGFFAVDGGSTAATAQALQKHGLAARGVKGGGYDLTPITEQLLAAGEIEFTIDQQPYLQGFLPIVELYLYNVTRRLAGIADVDTGLKFVDRTTVVAYDSTKSRYEGTDTAVGVHKA